MVVAYTEPSTSNMAKKKARRRMSKKANTSSTMEDQTMEEDGSTAMYEQTAPADDDELIIDAEPITLDMNNGPSFEPLPASEQRSTLKSEIRRIPIPPHRMSPLQKDWVNVFGPLTELLGLQVRMNLPRKSVEIRVRLSVVSNSVIMSLKPVLRLQNIPRKSVRFKKELISSRHMRWVSMSMYSFPSYLYGSLLMLLQDSIALLRLDDLYLDSFEIKDVKTLHGDHLSRAIGMYHYIIYRSLCLLRDRPNCWSRWQNQVHYRERESYSYRPRGHVRPSSFLLLNMLTFRQ
jgi:RNA-binding protein PNO1